MKTVLVVIGIFVLVFGFGFLINWLLAKGLIWVLYELFKIDWRDKFWPVFVMLIIVSTILGWLGKSQSK